VLDADYESHTGSQITSVILYVWLGTFVFGIVVGLDQTDTSFLFIFFMSAVNVNLNIIVYFYLLVAFESRGVSSRAALVPRVVCTIIHA